MAYIYFDLHYAVKTHEKILEISGGISGVIDAGRLDSILEHIQNDLYYKAFEEKLTILS